MILSDIGPKTTEEILHYFEDMNLHDFKINDFNYFKNKLKYILIDMIPVNDKGLFIDPDTLNIIMISGVNGTGKTSFAAKLAYYYKKRNFSSLLVPADTFRAGAINQLTILSKQISVDILRTSEGSDPASVVFDGIQSAKSKNKNLLIIDTAGRLHTYNNLMKELEKMLRIINKNAPDANCNNVLVIDATTGQNGLLQAKYFQESLDISSIALTKMDGTSKGGIVFTIQKELHIPVSFLTFGENVNDLCEYNTENFIETLLD